MSDDAFDAELYARQAAAALDLAIAPEHLPGVVENLRIVHRMAQLVMGFPLPDDEEPAPVFRP